MWPVHQQYKYDLRNDVPPFGGFWLQTENKNSSFTLIRVDSIYIYNDWQNQFSKNFPYQFVSVYSVW